MLGGGGGGTIAEGTELAELAFAVGTPRLVRLDDLKDDDVVVTVSSVGAPAAEDQYVKPVDYALALQMLQEHLGGRIAGIITSENGAMGTVNGWFQSAVTGIPVVDAAGNGRAHPTGVMGSMALDRLEGYRSVQAAVGGDPDEGRRISLVSKAAWPPWIPWYARRRSRRGAAWRWPATRSPRRGFARTARWEPSPSRWNSGP